MRNLPVFSNDRARPRRPVGRQLEISNSIKRDQVGRAAVAMARGKVWIRFCLCNPRDNPNTQPKGTARMKPAARLARLRMRARAPLDIRRSIVTS
jgi:hypothetical protein